MGHSIQYTYTQLTVHSTQLTVHGTLSRVTHLCACQRSALSDYNSVSTTHRHAWVRRACGLPNHLASLGHLPLLYGLVSVGGFAIFQTTLLHWGAYRVSVGGLAVFQTTLLHGGIYRVSVGSYLLVDLRSSKPPCFTGASAVYLLAGLRSSKPP